MTSNNFYELAEACLYSRSVNEKIELTAKAKRALDLNELVFVPIGDLKPVHEVSFPDQPLLIDPRDMPRRGLHTPDGRIAFLHAIAHIEFTAIHLAWDIAYRFREMPDSFRIDWLKVAIEEAHHFNLLRGRLLELGADYGDLPAHRGLWDLAENTAGSVLDRLALVPRFMEARGLDVTPAMIKKLQELNDAPTVEILTLIYHDELGHVRLGTEWFKNQCSIRSLDYEACYFNLLDQYQLGEVRGAFNQEARLLAGFTEYELERLATHKVFKPQASMQETR